MAKARKSKMTHKKHPKKGKVSSRRKKGGYLFYPGPGDEESFFVKLNPFRKKNEVSDEPVVEEEVTEVKEITPSELPASDTTTSPEPEPQEEATPEPEPESVPESPTAEEVVEEKEEEEEKETMSGGKKKRKGKRSRKSKKKSKKQKGGKKKKKTKKRAYKKRK